jgi:hypothetical protein
LHGSNAGTIIRQSACPTVKNPDANVMLDIAAPTPADVGLNIENKG